MWSATCDLICSVFGNESGFVLCAHMSRISFNKGRKCVVIGKCVLIENFIRSILLDKTLFLNHCASVSGETKILYIFWNLKNPIYITYSF